MRIARPIWSSLAIIERAYVEVGAWTGPRASSPALLECDGPRARLRSRCVDRFRRGCAVVQAFEEHDVARVRTGQLLMHVR